MEWLEYDSDTCSAARALEVLGDRWTMLVLREVFNGVLRFDDISAHLGVARDVLTRRLNTLVNEGVLVRVPYREPGTRTRYEYRLTDAGRDLYPVITTLMRWGDKYLAGDGGPPMVLQHHCGHPVVATVIAWAWLN